MEIQVNIIIKNVHKWDEKMDKAGLKTLELEILDELSTLLELRDLEITAKIKTNE